MIIFLFGSTSGVFAQENKVTLTISVTNITEEGGVIYADLFSSEDSFLEKSYRTEKITAFNKNGTIVFKNIPQGVYAVSIYHDINNNGKLDENWIGIPKEPVGMSNNPGFGIPKWKKTKFSITKEDKTISVELDD